MDAYKCVVRLSGELGQEVPKNNICAAHVILMKLEHGPDAVHSVEKINSKMMVEIPGPAAANGRPAPTLLKQMTQEMARDFLNNEFGEEKVGKAFGVTYGSMLPESLKGFEKPISMVKKKVTQGIKSASISDEALDEVEDEIQTGPEEEEGADEESDEEVL